MSLFHSVVSEELAGEALYRQSDRYVQMMARCTTKGVWGNIPWNFEHNLFSAIQYTKELSLAIINKNGQFLRKEYKGLINNYKPLDFINRLAYAY